jgi:hypothetical protein
MISKVCAACTTGGENFLSWFHFPDNRGNSDAIRRENALRETRSKRWSCAQSMAIVGIERSATRYRKESTSALRSINAIGDMRQGGQCGPARQLALSSRSKSLNQLHQTSD